MNRGNSVRPIRVGFVINPATSGWLGGLNYFRNLLAAVAEEGSGEVEPVLVIGNAFPAGALVGFPDVEIVRTGGLDRFRPGWFARGAAMTLARRDRPLERVLKRARIDVLSHSVPTGRGAPIPSLAWIPDFQHVHLPEFFGARELRSRDRHFRRLADDATLVILSSETAAEDLRAFRPAAAPKARVLRFVADPPAATGEDLRAAYDLPERFFLVANQFWAHKNHIAVVEALAVLRERGEPVTVAATGDARDYRSPEVFDRLAARAQELGVDGDLRVLGRVPYEHVGGLLRASVALISPSLFEGWNTGVEEAKSAGKRVIVSDIPVHREQDAPGARYFDPHDPAGLADAIEATLADTGEAADSALATAAAEALPARRRAFAERYEDVLREALMVS